jgi:hypothetical protein
MLKTVGAQLHGAIMNFIGFYVVGLPIALSLLLRSSLENFGKILFKFTGRIFVIGFYYLGFWFGIIIGTSSLVTMQLVYLYRLDWEKEARIVKS